jgi:hypothetical protein
MVWEWCMALMATAATLRLPKVTKAQPETQNLGKSWKKYGKILYRKILKNWTAL